MKNVRLFFLISLLGIILLGCSGVSDPTEIIGNKGSLSVFITEKTSRSLLPEISMEPASYQISGVGPDGASFSQTTTTETYTAESLQFGAWEITVTAFNESGDIIGSGSGTTTVLGNSIASVAITVVPFEGFGTLDLTLNWLAGEVQTPQVDSSLIPSSGSERDLDFAITDTTATFNASDIAAGYYTLVLQLLDDDVLTMGAVEVVRIVADNTTTGSYLFDKINQSSGDIDIDITADFSNPLDIVIAGAEETKPQNHLMDMSAATTNYNDNVTYVWYVNGTSVSTGSTFSFDDSYGMGYYRIDVTGFSADGTRAGSQSFLVEVIESTSPVVYVPFRTLWKVDALTLRIPLDSEGSYDFDIDWGDGTTEHITASDDNYIQHSYSSNGNYEVVMTGRCIGFGAYSAFRTLKRGELLDVMQWGSVKMHNKGMQFYNYGELTGFSATDKPDISNITNFGSAFLSCSVFNEDLGDWDVSNVVDMGFMFSSCELFNQDLNSWETGNVTDMAGMFNYCLVFNGSIDSWDTSKVTNMSTMFYATPFNGDITDWVTSNVIKMDRMFKRCENFNQEIDSWDTSKVTDMSEMFSGCDSFNQDLNHWDTAKVTDMSKMFSGCSIFNGDISTWETGQVTDMSQMFNMCYDFNSNISEWDTSQVTDMSTMFFYCYDFNQDIGEWDTSKVTDMSDMLCVCFDFNQDISSWDTSNVTSMYRMFSSSSSFNCGNIDISTWVWDVSNVTNTQQIFKNTLLEGSEPAWYLNL